MDLSLADYTGIAILLTIFIIVVKFIIPIVIDTHRSQKEHFEILRTAINNDEIRREVQASKASQLTTSTVATVSASDTICAISSCDTGC